MLKRLENLKVVSNASPLIYLSKIGRLRLLYDLFGAISIPDAVANEILRGAVRDCDAQEDDRASVGGMVLEGWVKSLKTTGFLYSGAM
jgi:predicted nucleic acid-binding protein